ncbi:hypothetical protein KDD30_18140 (plasmid) [Photobacterium sp. GJ3]|uniref:hypothetical protein n=1 Tax=Photobacterium sp. GJ3 TaxID=2829502 RepID=UPI001B8B0608|nr:hypothetical protein [Photobacterium sp. GJ3]QUJ70072.1 hypothetical protein KDD30_18140 [Photobacterium sp. GJ3]
MKFLMKVVVVLLLMAASFWAGMQVERLRYEDVCLDMGGGKNPGDYPICVIQSP